MALTLVNKQRYKNVVHVGVSIDDPDDEDLNGGGRALNRVYYAVQQSSFGPVLIGLEYLNWTTAFKGFDDGKSDRFKFYAAYNF